MNRQHPQAANAPVHKYSSLKMTVLLMDQLKRNFGQHCDPRYGVGKKQGEAITLTTQQLRAWRRRRR